MKKRCFIIAEAGVNHNGSPDIAFKLCDAARAAGADAIKFQTFRTEYNVLRSCEWVDYQKQNMPEIDTHWDMLKALELGDDVFARLKRHCDNIGIEFISTPSERKSLKLLLEIGVGTIKLSSCDVNNIPLLRAAGRSGKKIILSTGMCTLDDIDRAVRIIRDAGTADDKLVLLHCHTSYPTRMEDVNLRVMCSLRERYKLTTGFSDHTVTAEMAVAAVALGAEVIEKHFTLDNKMPGPDHSMSLTPDELEYLVKTIRRTEIGLGTGDKMISQAESEVLKAYSRGIVAEKELKIGDIITEDNITVKRPCHGIDVREWDSVIGRKTARPYTVDEPLTWEGIQ